MTVPLERSRAVQTTREFLFDLLDPKKTPKVPREIRMRASRCLRHFPADYDINYAADGAPAHFGHLDKDESQVWLDTVLALEKKSEKKKKKK